MKKNPLRNLHALLKLNVYAKKMSYFFMEQSMEAMKPVKGSKVNY